MFKTDLTGFTTVPAHIVSAKANIVGYYYGAHIYYDMKMCAIADPCTKYSPVMDARRPLPRPHRLILIIISIISYTPLNYSIHLLIHLHIKLAEPYHAKN